MELLRFYAESYVELVGYLERLKANLNADELDAATEEQGFDPLPELTGKRINLSEERNAEAKAILALCKKLCARINLQVCVRHCDELLRLVIEDNWLGAEDVHALHANVQRELGCHFFVGVPSDRRELFRDGRKRWEDIATAFPAAIDDIEEMNKCFALCRYGAAVMHSLLVVEHGLVALGKRIGATDPKEGWDASCRQLERVIKAGREGNATGIDFGELEQINACVQVMKLAWRNKVNHATGKPIVMHGGFSADVTEEIMHASRGFLRRIKTALNL